MNKTIKTAAVLALTLAMSLPAGAQNVYNKIKQNVENILTDDTSNSVVIQINRFKKDALDYMLIKMREQMPDTTVTVLDEQALALNEFMAAYVSTLTRLHNADEKVQVKVLQLFMDSSYSNPFFHDDDKELTLSYYNDEKNLTRFSLDTDWRKALSAVLHHKF